MDKLAHYRIDTLLGEGAYAWVYRAFDEKLERDVALKVLKPAWLSDPEAVARFKREARTMARLHHPHIVQVYDVDEFEGQVFLSQYFVDGQSLARRLKEGSLPWDVTLDILRQVAGALDYAHDRDVVHRDIKSANILLEQSGQAYLCDFGLVRAAEGSTALTATSGGMIGTPAYMAPEQWRGETATPATDVYALACVVFEMLTGRVLFDGPTPPAIMTRHIIDEPPLPAEWPQGVPAGVDQVLRQGLAKVPAQRFDRAGKLAAQLATLKKNAEETKPSWQPAKSAKKEAPPPAPPAQKPAVQQSPPKTQPKPARAERKPAAPRLHKQPNAPPRPAVVVEEKGGVGQAIIGAVIGVILTYVGFYIVFVLTDTSTSAEDWKIVSSFALGGGALGGVIAGLKGKTLSGFWNWLGWAIFSAAVGGVLSGVVLSLFNDVYDLSADPPFMVGALFGSATAFISWTIIGWLMRKFS